MAADAMRGLLLTKGRLQFRSDLPTPEPRDGEVVVRPLRAGVCATDLALARGYMGFSGIPGHEFVGVAQSGRYAGQRVVGDINVACGVCAWCLDGLPNHCPHRTVLGILNHGGAFAEQLVLPEVNLYLVPEAVTTDAATFTEPLAAAFEIERQLGDRLRSGQRALVVGDGKLGLLCAHVLHLRGLDVHIIGRHPERRELLWSGAVIEDPATLAGQRDFDLAVEATGRAEVLAGLVGAVRPRGTIILKTTTEQASTLDLSLLVVNELTLLGSRCGPFDVALAALAAGQVPVTKLVEARYPLSDGVEAFAAAGKRGVLKVLVDIDSGAVAPA